MASLFDSVKKTTSGQVYGSATANPFQAVSQTYIPVADRLLSDPYSAGTIPNLQGGVDGQTGVLGEATVAQQPAVTSVVPVAPVATGGTTTGGTAVAGQTNALDQALREAEALAAQRKAQEDAELAAERERLSGEYQGLTDRLGFKRTSAEAAAAQGKTDIESQRQLALGTLGRLRGETQGGLESNISRAETERGGALQSALAGQQDAQRGIRGRLSAMGNYTADSSALPSLMGLSERDYIQNVQGIQQQTNQYIQDLTRESNNELSSLNDKEAYVENDALQQIAQLRLGLNDQLGELDLAQASGDREKIGALTQAINLAKSRMIDIDANLSDYKNQVYMQKADLQAKASTAVQDAADRLRQQEEANAVWQSWMQDNGWLTNNATNTINAGLDSGGGQWTPSPYSISEDERLRSEQQLTPYVRNLLR